MKSRLFLFLGLALAIGAQGCADDRSRVARTPEAAQPFSAEPAPAPVTLTPTPSPPILDNVVQNPPAPSAAATGELDPKAVEIAEEARENAEAQAREKAKWDKVGRDADRKNTDTYARERLAKAIHRATSAENQSSRVPAARRFAYTNAMTAFTLKKTEVEARIGGLAATGNDEWNITKDALDHALDELDALSYRIEGELY